MILDYYIINPTGNITALVLSKTTLEDYTKVSAFIMKNHPDVEQVGFVDFSSNIPKLRMAGGEFCGNATISTAALQCKLKGIKDAEVLVSVYGTKEPVTVKISENNNSYTGVIFLQRPKNIMTRSFVIGNSKYSFPLVECNGISHIIADKTMDVEIAKKIIKQYCRSLNLPAMGIMIFDIEKSTLCPLVYVKECNTCFLENSCISGSCAVAGYLSLMQDNVNVTIKEPGGNIKISASGSSEKIRLSGRAEITEHIVGEFEV